jgi:hypothetical protein
MSPKKIHRRERRERRSITRSAAIDFAMLFFKAWPGASAVEKRLQWLAALFAISAVKKLCAKKLCGEKTLR